MATVDPVQDPAVQRFISDMPEPVANSLSFEQLLGIQHALTSRDGKRHSVDMRLTMKIPMVPFSFYMVMLCGKNRRLLSSREQWFAGFSFIAFLTSFVTSAILIGLLTLYLAKSALGIDLFPGMSTGIWDWFKSLW